MHATKTTANQKACICISRVDSWKNAKIVGVKTKYELVKPLISSIMITPRKKIKQTLLHLSRNIIQ